MSKFKEKIIEIFGTHPDDYSENSLTETVTFEIRRAEFNAEKLFALSDLLGTGSIGIETETRYGGYYETCSYEYGVMVIEARGVKLD